MTDANEEITMLDIEDRLSDLLADAGKAMQNRDTGGGHYDYDDWTITQHLTSALYQMRGTREVEEEEYDDDREDQT